jgi:hypothetical protein
MDYYKYIFLTIFINIINNISRKVFIYGKGNQVITRPSGILEFFF